MTTRATPILGLAAHLGRGVQRVATDAVAGRRVRFPRGIDDLTPAVLTKIMGRQVDSLSVIGGNAGTSSRARLRLTGVDVPESVFVKMPATTAATRLMGELGRLGHTEVRFYDELSAELSGVPASYGTAYQPSTGRYVILLEDLAVHRCEFPDTLHPLDYDQAGLVVELLARLHATFWNRLPPPGTSGPLDWVYTASADRTSLLTGSLLKLSARRIAQRTDIPVATGRFIDENYRAAAQLIDRPPHTVMHGDAHPGNVYFRDGRAGLLDWQAVRRGHPSRELAYTLTTGLTVGDRRAHERELLDHYRDTLSAAGGPELDRDELWSRYREAGFYAYVAALITAGLGGMQAESIALEGLRRGVAALTDLDTVQVLRNRL